MKKMISAVVAAVVFVANIAMAQEQYDFNNPSISGVAGTSYSAAPTSGHSISLTIIGLEYSYEAPVGGNWTVIFRGGFPCVITGREVTEQSISDGQNTSTNLSFNYTFGPQPGITLEPRLYTSLGRRQMMGRNTGNNSSDFLSVKARLSTVGFDVIPVYGIRRGGSHWFREYTFGYGYHGLFNGFLAHFNFRIGYSF